MSEKKPVPITATRKPRVCPVCNKPSYSASGIHPQCAIAQADKPRCDRLMAQRKAEAAADAARRAAER